MSKRQRGWYVLRKGRQDLGPLTHREARTAALEIARDTGGRVQDVPRLERRFRDETKVLRPWFPELARRRA